jgi:hypothetical protein
MTYKSEKRWPNGFPMKNWKANKAKPRKHKNVFAYILGGIVILLLSIGGFFYSVEKATEWLQSDIYAPVSGVAHLE